MGLLEEELRRLLDDHQKKEWLKAIEALRIAFAWCAEAATPEQVMDGTPEQERRAKVLKVLFLLADALVQSREYFQVLQEFLTIGQPGVDTEQDLEKGEQELSQMQARLEQLVRQEEVLRKQAEERGALWKELEERKEKLERLRQLADPQAVEALKHQVEELEEHLPAEGMKAEQLEQKIQDRAGKLITLYENYLSVLKPKVRSLLERAEVKEQEIQSVISQLCSARERYDQVSQEAKKREEELKPYIEADCIVAQSLPGAQNILSLLDKAEALVRDAERAIKTIIEDNEKQAQCQTISITGEVKR